MLVKRYSIVNRIVKDCSLDLLMSFLDYINVIYARKFIRIRIGAQISCFSSRYKVSR